MCTLLTQNNIIIVFIGPNQTDCHSVLLLFNSNYYLPKWILLNNPSDKVKGIIQQYSLSLRRIIIIVLVIAQVIIRAIAFSFILFISSSKTSRKHAVAILKISASLL